MVLVVSMLSCSKEEDVEQLPSPPKYYFPLAVGNTWIYENLMVDTLGNEKRLNFIDIVTISDEIILNGETHYVFMGNQHPYRPKKWSVESC